MSSVRNSTMLGVPALAAGSGGGEGHFGPGGPGGFLPQLCGAGGSAMEVPAYVPTMPPCDRVGVAASVHAPDELCQVHVVHCLRAARWGGSSDGRSDVRARASKQVGNKSVCVHVVVRACGACTLMRAHTCSHVCIRVSCMHGVGVHVSVAGEHQLPRGLTCPHYTLSSSPPTWPLWIQRRTASTR